MEITDEMDPPSYIRGMLEAEIAKETAMLEDAQLADASGGPDDVVVPKSTAVSKQGRETDIVTGLGEVRYFFTAAGVAVTAAPLPPPPLTLTHHPLLPTQHPLSRYEVAFLLSLREHGGASSKLADAQSAAVAALGPAAPFKHEPLGRKDVLSGDFGAAAILSRNTLPAMSAPGIAAILDKVQSSSSRIFCNPCGLTPLRSPLPSSVHTLCTFA